MRIAIPVQCEQNVVTSPCHLVNSQTKTDRKQPLYTSDILSVLVKISGMYHYVLLLKLGTNRREVEFPSQSNVSICIHTPMLSHEQSNLGLS